MLLCTVSKPQQAATTVQYMQLSSRTAMIHNANILSKLYVLHHVFEPPQTHLNKAYHQNVMYFFCNLVIEVKYRAVMAYRVMGILADLTFIQQTVMDSPQKEDKPQKLFFKRSSFF